MSWLLPIADMPAESAAITTGRLYFLLHDDEEAALRPTLSAMLLAGGRQAVWVMSGEDAEGMETLAHEVAGLRLLQWQASKHQGLAGRLLEEFDHFGIPMGAAVVLEGADRLLAGRSEADADEALRVCRRWAEQHQCALILLFPNRSDAPEIVTALTRNADCAAGFAHFRRGDGGLWWDTFHWLAGGRMVTGQQTPLIEDGHGLFARRSTIARRKEQEHAPDEALVLAEQGVAAGSHRLPADWRGVENAEALVATARERVAATVIFAFTADTGFDTLARSVYALRRTCGPRLKIVVREVDSSLRHSREQMLLQLGANLIVPPEVSFSHFLGLVGMVQGQQFSRAIAADYDSAVAAVVPTPECGYLKPMDFARAVKEALEQSQALGIECALVRLPLMTGLAPIDALRHFEMHRPGDLCSADEDSLLLFLFACRDADVTATLARLFRLPVSDLFEGEVRCFSVDSIRSEIKAFVQRANSKPLPDLEDALDEIAATGVRDTQQRSPATGATVEMRRRPQPTPAQPHPLRLRPDADPKEARR